MTWTYSGNPADSSRDAVRFHTGDTDTTDQLLQDEEIDYLLTEFSTVREAAAQACEAIAASLSREADVKVGPVSEQLSQRAEAYEKRARDLRRQLARDIEPWMGARSEDDKDTATDDADRVEPAFRREMFTHEPAEDNPPGYWPD